MSFLSSIWNLLFPANAPKGKGTPADQKPHDTRGGETIDAVTGIAEVDGQIVDDTEIDPGIQDKAADKFNLLPGDKK